MDFINLTYIDAVLISFIKWYFSGVNECAEKTDNCDENAICTDTEDGFSCNCTGGFTGDGKTCQG